MKIKSFEFDPFKTACYSIPLVNLVLRSVEETHYAEIAAKRFYQMSQGHTQFQINPNDLYENRQVKVQNPYKAGIFVQTVMLVALTILLPQSWPGVTCLAGLIAISIGYQMAQYSIGYCLDQGNEVAIAKAWWKEKNIIRVGLLNPLN